MRHVSTNDQTLYDEKFLTDRLVFLIQNKFDAPQIPGVESRPYAYQGRQMIRCTIELIPHGQEDRKRVIGCVEIANDATGTNEVGNYNVVLKKTPPFPGALRLAWKRGLFEGRPNEDDEIIAGHIEGHHRTKRGVYDLLYRALRVCGLEKRNP